uniref:Uncharacterized protein n=1 Tax=Solanum lycopersicum TaxID=4081 RepID=A0A3Q7GSR8_SOLLC
MIWFCRWSSPSLCVKAPFGGICLVFASSMAKDGIRRLIEKMRQGASRQLSSRRGRLDGTLGSRGEGEERGSSFCGGALTGSH